MGCNHEKKFSTWYHAAKCVLTAFCKVEGHVFLHYVIPYRKITKFP